MSDDAYVHDPEDVAATDGDADSEFGRSGWLLVGMMLFCFVVAPLLIWLNPPALPFRMAYLVLPLVPALLLGVLAVWVTAGN